SLVAVSIRARTDVRALRLQMLCKEGHDGSPCRSRVVGSRPHPDDSATSTVGKLIIELVRSILRVEAVGRAFVITHCCSFACSSRPRCNERVTGVLVVLVIVLRTHLNQHG